MKVVACCHVRNERAIIGFWIRHYAQFCERLHVFDDGSTDGTREMVQSFPGVDLHDLPFTGLDESALLDLAHGVVRAQSGKADWCIWADVDEFLHAENIRERLRQLRACGYPFCRTVGFNMTSKPLPTDDGEGQLTAIYRTGIRAPVYSKPIIVNPSAGIEWSRGKHTIQNADCLPAVPWNDEYKPDPLRVKLLHYRFLTPEYVRERSARQYERSTNKATAWSCAPDYKGEHSPEWTASVARFARDVVNDEACYLPAPHDA